jgi:hypothetical protein
LIAPNPLSTITAPPSSNHGVSPPAGRGVGGPVEASVVLADGETDGASACIAGDVDAVDAVAADGVAGAPPAADGVAPRDAATAVGALGGGHTWLNETAGGCIPAPTE